MNLCRHFLSVLKVSFTFCTLRFARTPGGKFFNLGCLSAGFLCLMPKVIMSPSNIPVLDICLEDVCVLVADVRDSCVQDDCVRNALCPSAGCFTMRCHCLRWLCARCLCYGCISGLSVLYVCVYNVSLQDIYPRCLCIRWLCGGCGCAASLCV